MQKILEFNPAIHGWHFPNDFSNHIIGAIRTGGLCGGMCLSAFNYFRYGLNTPYFTWDDLAFTRKVDVVFNEGTPEQFTKPCIDIEVSNPGRDHLIFDYIFHSQFATYSMDAYKFLVLWPPIDTPENHHSWSWREEFDAIRNAINTGLYPLLGLRSPKQGDILGHQVLAIGFDDTNSIVLVYDPNHPNVTMGFRDLGTSHEYGRWDGTQIVDQYQPQYIYRSFFVMGNLDKSRTSNETGYNVFTNAANNCAVRPNYVERVYNFADLSPHVQEIVSRIPPEALWHR